MGKFRNVQVANRDDEIKALALAELTKSAASPNQVGTDTIESGLDQPSPAPQQIKPPVDLTAIQQVEPGAARPEDVIDPALRQGKPQQALETQQQLAEQKNQMLAAEQREAERVPALSEITEEKGGVSSFEDNTYDAFGSALRRADNFTNMFHGTLESGATIAGVWKGAKETADISPLGDITRQQMSLKDVVFGPNVNAGKINEKGQTVVDPEFGRVMGFVTEQLIGSDIAQENQDVETFFEDKTAPAPVEEDITRSGSSNLGREIVKAWKRDQNFRDGRPTDDYDISTMTNDEFELLGTAAKEMYSAANPAFLERIFDPTEQKVRFRLTPAGSAVIQKAKAATPNAFQNKEIPPTTAPRPVIDRFGGTGEGAARRKFRTTAVKNRRLRKVEEARNNMNSVAHVVDPLRRKLYWQYCRYHWGLNRGSSTTTY